MRRVLVLPQPLAPMMVALLEHTCELAASLPHIEGAYLVERRVSPEGLTMVRQQWRARATLPSLLKPHLHKELQDWTLQFERRAGDLAVRWQAESRALQVAGNCCGSLDFAPALGGRGTLITLRCEVPSVSAALRTIFGAIVERHWRAIAHAAAARVAAASVAGPAGRPHTMPARRAPPLRSAPLE